MWSSLDGALLCVCVCACVCGVCVFVCVCMCVCMCPCMYMCMCEHVCVCVYVCVPLYACSWLYVCMVASVCTYVCVCVCVCEEETFSGHTQESWEECDREEDGFDSHHLWRVANLVKGMMDSSRLLGATSKCNLNEGFAWVLRPILRLGYNMLTGLLVSILSCWSFSHFRHPSIHSYIHLSSIHLCPFVCPFIHFLFVYSYVHVCPSIPSFTRRFVHSFICPSIHLSINWSILPPIHPSIVLMSLHGMNTLN